MRTGVLGGTFDPIHNGHAFLAREAARIFSLDQVLFVVAHGPPHKTSDDLSSPYHRYAMTALATQDQPTWVACQTELQRPAPSYTIETLDQLRRRCGQPLCFIAGSDSLRDLPLWKDYDRLLKEYSFVFVQRPGQEIALNRVQLAPEMGRAIRAADSQEQLEIAPGVSFLLSLDAPDISSTRLRQTLAAGAVPPAEHMAAPVIRYAIKHRLYERL